MEQVVESLCHVTGDGVVNRALVFNSAPSTVEETVDGIEVTRVGTIGAAGSVPIAPGFPAALKRGRADAIVLHEPNPWALLSFTIARPRPSLAIWFHSEVVRPRLQYALFYHPIARAAYRQARRIVVSSPALAEHATALAAYRDRIRVIPFGIDPRPWTATQSVRARAAEIRGSAGDRPLLLFAGRMVPYKGIDVLLRALPQTTAAAVLVGRGPALARWKALADELGLADRITFAGDVAHDVSPGDVAALRAAIVTLAADPALRDRMGAAGRARVESEFSLARMREAVAALYRELLAESPRG